MSEEYFVWKDEYLVGVEIIDKQHKGLVECANDLHKHVMSDMDASREAEYWPG